MEEVNKGLTRSCLVGVNMHARGTIMTKGGAVDQAVTAELKELRNVKKAHEQLKIEHDLLKKAITFTSARKATSSRSSKTSKDSTR